MTVRQLITRALRFLGMVGEGQPAPSAYDADVAKEGLINLYKSLIASGAFGPLTDVATDEDYEAGENERIANISDADITITLPATIEATDPDTGITTERAPKDRSVVVVVGAETSIYDADAGLWVDLDGLTLNSDAPLGNRYGTPLAALLAVALAPDYGSAIPASLAVLADDGARALYMKPPQMAVMDAGLTRWNRV